jgi:hypothetical protein
MSDGLITDKTNVSLSSTPFAPILAIIGTARFLRAHRVANDLVAFYTIVFRINHHYLD